MTKNTFTLKSLKSKCLTGKLSVPADKSISIRALLISSICFGNTRISNLLESEDVINTLNCLKNLGVKILKKGGKFEVFGQGGFFENPQKKLFLGNSGTGLRLLIGLLSTRNMNVDFTGDKSLSSRPMMRIVDPLERMNVLIKHNNGYLPIKLIDNNDSSIPIKYSLEIGSAQVKSAILLASLNLNGITIIKEKFPSRDHTEILLEYLGANIKKQKNIITLKSPNFLKPKDIFVPGDFSSAAFLIVAALITKKSKIILKSVGINFFRTGLLEVLKKMNARINIFNKKIINGEIVGDIMAESSNLVSTEVDSKLAPRLIDEFPILFVAASYASGKSTFKGLEELQFKESDRLKTMATALKDAGVELGLKKDSLEVIGNKTQQGGNYVITESDHRIAMSMLTFGFAAEKSITIDDSSMIKTSFPKFKEIFNSLNANINNV